MSLDVYLTTKEKRQHETSGIFIRENGETKEITEEEWKERNPGQTPVKVESIDETNECYAANITHNLGRMASEAGIYEALWRPEEIGITKASQLVEPLTKGLELLKIDPERFEKLNASNGWGKYEHFVPWVENYLNACKEYPEADIAVSR
jgi:hypothetical protein